MTNTVIILDNKTRRSRRMWELDFMRGICIIMMCIDHMFYDVYTMFSSWRSSANQGAQNLFLAAQRYLGRGNRAIILDADVIQYCEFVFIWFILAVVLISFFVKLIKNKGKVNKEQFTNFCMTLLILSVCSLSIALVNKMNYSYSSGRSLRDFIHPIVLWIFFFLCGESCRFSRSNIKRTIQIAVCALMISLVTYIGEKVLDEEMTVRFGVLHMLATAVFIYTVIEIIFTLIFKNKNKRKYAISACCLVLGVLSYFFYQYIWMLKANGTLVKTDALAWFHYAFAVDFASSDWMMLSENLHRVLFGAAVAPFIYPQKKSLIPALQPLQKGFFCTMGRNTLWVVLAHQPLIAAILYLVSLLV